MIAPTVTGPSGLLLDHVSRLVRGLSDAAVVVDRTLRPVAWNESYARLVGLRPRRFQRVVDGEGYRCHQLFNLDLCESSCLAGRVFEEGRALRMDEIAGRALRGNDSEEQTLIVSALPIRDEAGETQVVIEVYRDVTAEVRIQERYKLLLEAERRRAQTLEELVEQRTADLERSLVELRATRAQLVQSEKLSSLGRLIAGIAHEINNPMNFIYGNTEFLREYVEKFIRLIDAYDGLGMADDDRARMDALRQELDYEYTAADVDKLLGSIRTGAERATRIIADLRAFMHGGTIERMPVEVWACIDRCLGLLIHEIKGVEVVRAGVQPAPIVIANEGHLSQVFMNLLTNAAHAIGNSGRITIEVQEVAGGITVTVADDGYGISEENLLKVFDPFFTTKAVGQGTGLGLALAYSMVDAHGGTLSVRSVVGEGAAFTVFLPTGSP